jgi:hypothetical protein
MHQIDLHQSTIFFQSLRYSKIGNDMVSYFEKLSECFAEGQLLIGDLACRLQKVGAQMI